MNLLCYLALTVAFALMRLRRRCSLTFHSEMTHQPAMRDSKRVAGGLVDTLRNAAGRYSHDENGHNASATELPRLLSVFVVDSTDTSLMTPDRQ